jgi:hypothetical protein
MQGEMWVINTDAQVLAGHSCSNKMQIGLESTRGLGCGGNPEVGRVAAEESADGLKKVCGVCSALVSSQSTRAAALLIMAVLLGTCCYHALVVTSTTAWLPDCLLACSWWLVLTCCL